MSRTYGLLMTIRGHIGFRELIVTAAAGMTYGREDSVNMDVRQMGCPYDQKEYDTDLPNTYA